MNGKFTDNLFNFIGIIGVACILGSYFMLQNGQWDSDEMNYLGTNIIGSALVLVSLAKNWNLPSAMIQTCWILISLYGIFKDSF